MDSTILMVALRITRHSALFHLLLAILHTSEDDDTTNSIILLTSEIRHPFAASVVSNPEADFVRNCSLLSFFFLVSGDVS
ncbi:uncharacterized protein B0H64DRAFT_9675 [Chaetomium fimeti]|uniref:Secreted protein n=1 Tax=Chaetomium fimeti TaxID=1854472 RepID=A0AAE0HP93_9PEZI|nr:hypothetical protein B0H64DRAFT_9675 [Chaetomium fimeti]